MHVVLHGLLVSCFVALRCPIRQPILTLSHGSPEQGSPRQCRRRPRCSAPRGTVDETLVGRRWKTIRAGDPNRMRHIKLQEANVLNGKVVREIKQGTREKGMGMMCGLGSGAFTGHS